MKKLNKTIYKFKWQGKNYEVDWLTDATCQSDEMVCDIFKGKGRNAEVVGNMTINKKDGKRMWKKMAIAEIQDIDESN